MAISVEPLRIASIYNGHNLRLSNTVPIVLEITYVAYTRVVKTNTGKVQREKVTWARMRRESNT